MVRLKLKPACLMMIATVLILLSVEAPGQALGPQPKAYHTIGLNSDGTVYTWGRNTYGQLGNGTTNSSLTPVKVLTGAYNGTTYLEDDPNNKIIAVALGGYHSIALAADGTVYTWGYNAYGQLGDSTTTDRTTPVKVLTGAYNGTTYLGDDPNNKIIAVAAGEWHSIALAADGTVYTWGSNGSGRLGDGTTDNSSTPVKVSNGEYSGSTYLGGDPSNKITAVVGGSSHSMALAADGTVYAWGYNYFGQLGDGSNSERKTPVKVLEGAYNGTTYLGDDPNNKITAVAAGVFHSVALAADGTVYTWGGNGSGQLGDSTTTGSSTPVKVSNGEYSGSTYLGGDPSNKIIAVALGGLHSMALAADGTVYAWGRNFYGQLGDSTTTDRTTPVKVLKGEYSSGTTYLGDDSNNNITAVAAGYGHSIALAADASVYAWGYNFYGQLGDGTTTNKSTPIKVHGVGNVGDLSLPVELASFTVENSRGGVLLTWTTESEIENLGFIIERRMAGSNWTKLADYQTNPELQGHGSTSMRHTYQYLDETVQPGMTYEYRLGDVDYRGETTWHKTVEVIVDAISNMATFGLQRAYPNPFNPGISVPVVLSEASEVRVAIYDIAGREVRILYRGESPAGRLNLTWDGTNNRGEIVGVGVYFLIADLKSLSTGRIYRYNQKVVMVR